LFPVIGKIKELALGSTMTPDYAMQRLAALINNTTFNSMKSPNDLPTELRRVFDATSDRRAQAQAGAHA
jgi:hypothetical protein